MATKFYPLSILDNRPLPRLITITSYRLDCYPDTPAGYKRVSFGKVPGTNFLTCTFSRVEEAPDERRD